MNAIGNIPQLPAVPAVPKVSTSVPAGALPTATVEEPVVLQAQAADSRSIEQRRFERVQRAAEQIANVYVVSNRTFTLFKDVTGQYVTRFRDLQTGKVTYIPEPELLKRSEPVVSRLV